MYNFLIKYGSAVSFGLGALVSVLFFLSVGAGLSKYNSLPLAEQYNTSMFDIGLMGSIVLLVILAIVAVVFSVLGVFNDFKGSARGLIGLAILAVIFFILYSMSPGEPEPGIVNAVNTFEKGTGTTIRGGVLKFIGGSIGLSVLLCVVGIVALFFAEIRNFFK